MVLKCGTVALFSRVEVSRDLRQVFKLSNWNYSQYPDECSYEKKQRNQKKEAVQHKTEYDENNFFKFKTMSLGTIYFIWREKLWCYILMDWNNISMFWKYNFKTKIILCPPQEYVFSAISNCKIKKISISTKYLFLYFSGIFLSW